LRSEHGHKSTSDREFQAIISSQEFTRPCSKPGGRSAGFASPSAINSRIADNETPLTSMSLPDPGNAMVMARIHHTETRPENLETIDF
jgi:hypothetical protein